jgi:hypothetical protein
MTNHDLQAGGSGDGPRAGQPKRRYFSAGYKLRILAEYEAAEKPGEKGRLASAVHDSLTAGGTTGSGRMLGKSASTSDTGPKRTCLVESTG